MLVFIVFILIFMVLVVIADLLKACRKARVFARVFAYVSAFIGLTMDGPGDWYLAGGGKGIGMALYMMACYAIFWAYVVGNIIKLARGKGFWVM